MSDGLAEYRRQWRALKDQTVLSEWIGLEVRLERRGRVWKGLCPFHDERTPSFQVDDDQQNYKCFGCGAKGDIFNWIREREKVDFAGAVKILKRGLGEDVSPARAADAAERRQAREIADMDRRLEDVKRAREIWQTSEPAAGTLAETYLRSRGVTCAIPQTIRFRPSLHYQDAGSRLATYPPAMVAGIQGRDGKLCGIHRTYLSRDGAGKADVKVAKKMLGSMQGGAVRFAKAAETLIVAEGIESGLSVLSAFRAVNEDCAVWCGLSLGNFHVCLPDLVKTVIIATDNDNKDPAAAEQRHTKAADAYVAEGRRVHIARPDEGCDFNDMLMQDLAAPAERVEGVPF